MTRVPVALISDGFLYPYRPIKSSPSFAADAAERARKAAIRATAPRPAPMDASYAERAAQMEAFDAWAEEHMDVLSPWERLRITARMERRAAMKTNERAA
jgi:hypothetical protein